MFGSFISLGWFCGTASSMSQYGLRCISGPFDWCFSELEGIIKLMDDDFRDFLNKKNLQVNENEPTWFKDVKYDITFVHEVKNDFEAEYKEIFKKYVRRINKFKDAFNSEKPVCFIRAVHKAEELDYIVRNKEYIKGVIKKFNPDNEIVFLVPRYMVLPERFDFKAYTLDIEKYEGSDTEALKKLFDTNEEFISWCCMNMDEEVRQRNLSFNSASTVAVPGAELSRRRILKQRILGHVKRIIVNK